MKKTLWTKDFTLITLGTVISAIGGTAMSFALSLVVFDNTSSTWLTGIFAAVMVIPSAVLPVLAAPYVDSHCRRNIIVRLDALSGILYLAFAAYLIHHHFSYGLYMVFGLAVNSIGAIYAQAYQSLYPELIPQGFAQKGYSVSSIIYPTAATLITPIAAVVYEKWGICVIFMAQGGLLLMAAAFECFIRADRTGPGQAGSFGFSAYCRELLGGVRYLKKEKGILSIYLYMMAGNAAANGAGLMTMAFFQSSSSLTTAMYSLLISSETVGRMAGGLFHYFVKIPPHKRYSITEKVYLLYETVDGIMLFMAYPVMIIIRFVLGFLGVNSATLRSAAVQKHLPSDMRARVGALFSVLLAAGQAAVRLAAGALGEVLPYPVVTVLFAAAGLLCVYWYVIRNRREIGVLYAGDF